MKQKRNNVIIISACLAGVKSRHDGKSSLRKNVLKKFKGSILIPVCPEQLGGFPTPRPRAEITRGGGGNVLKKTSYVIDEQGKDVTRFFIKGGNEVLRIARLAEAGAALLKEKSPSCGVRSIVRKGKIINGCGVTTALLKKEGVEVIGVE